MDGPAHVNVSFEEPLLGDWQGAPFAFPPARASAGQTGVTGVPESTEPVGARMAMAPTSWAGGRTTTEPRAVSFAGSSSPARPV